MIRTFPSPYHGSDSIEADAFSIVWTNPDFYPPRSLEDPPTVLVVLYLRHQVVYSDVYQVFRHHGNIDEWSCEPFGVPIEDLPWWLEEKLCQELEGADPGPPAPRGEA